MRINEDYWGGMGSTNLYYNFDLTEKSMFEAFNDGTIPFNEELDTSIAPWAINPKADILGLQYWFMTTPTSNANQLELHNYDLLDIESDEGTGVPFYFTGNNTFSSGNYWDDFYWYARNGFNQATLEDTTEVKVRTHVPIIRKFDYSRLVAVPYINYTYKSRLDWTRSVALGSFKQDYLEGSYYDDKWITGITFAWYYATNESSPNSRSQITLHMNTLANFKDVTEYITGANEAYSNPFLANLLTTDYIGQPNYASIYPCGTLNSYDYSIAYYTNEKQCYDYRFNIGTLPYPMGHSGSQYAGDESKLKPLIAPSGTWASRCLTYLDTEGMTKEGVLDYIYKQIAYLGVWVCDSSYSVQREALGSSEHWMLGEIGEDGVTTGNYKWGNEIAELENSDWVDPWEESGYKGRSDDPNKYDTDLQTHLVYHTVDRNRGAADYLMTGKALSELIRVFSWYKTAEADGDISEGTCAKLFGTTDPLELIQNIIYYPFDLNNGNWAGGQEYPWTGINGKFVGLPLGVQSGSLWAGQTELVVKGSPPVTGDPLSYLFVGSDEILEIDWNSSMPLYSNKNINYFQRYKSFLDYEPYCSAELYIPFCGSVKIDPELFVGHNVGVNYSLSPTDGSIKANIYRDGLNVDSITGNMGTQINLVTADIVSKINSIQQVNATIQAQKANTIKSLAGFALGAATTIATGGTGGVMATALGSTALGAIGTIESAHRSIQNAEYQIKNAEIPFKQLLTGSGELSQIFEPAIRLVIYRPTFLNGYTKDNFGDYGHTVGFACLKYDQLSNYSGLTVCSSIDLTGVECTSQEADMIKSALKTGVYLP